jgi:hypothetical protein
MTRSEGKRAWKESEGSDGGRREMHGGGDRTSERASVCVREREIERERETNVCRKGYELGTRKILYESWGFGMRIYGRSALLSVSTQRKDETREKEDK